MAAFYKWEASLFLMIVSMSMELFILSLGILILRIRNKLPEKKGWNEKSINLSFIVGLAAFTYIFARELGDYYGEFSNFDQELKLFQPIIEFKWSLIVIIISLGLSYYIDIKQLKLPERKNAILSEVFRLAILVFTIITVCITLPLFYREFSQSDEGLNKWVLVITCILLRMSIEIWYLKESQKNSN